MTKDKKDQKEERPERKMGIKGVIHLQLLDKDGKVVKEDTVENIIVNAGLDWLKDYAFNPSSGGVVMSHFAIGTGVTLEDPTDVALQTELFRKAYDDPPTFGAVGVVTVTTTFDAGEGTGAITELGIFNDPVAGIMWDRVVFDVYNKGASNQLKLTATFTLSAV